MRYLNVEQFDKYGFAKTFMIPKDQGRWRIYSYNKKADMEDLKYYEEVGTLFDTTIDKMIRVPQGHSNNIMVANKNDGGIGVTRMEIDGLCDGVITNEKNLMLLTVEADCVPIYILDPVKKAIGMVHSGWRGTVQRITENAIDIMKENYGSDVNDILIHFGPSICGNCYEVGMELIDEFKKILECDEIHEVFTPIIDKPEKYLLDVTKSLKMSLIRYGIKKENISKTEICTYHDNIFYSRRLIKDNTKVMLTGIMMV